MSERGLEKSERATEAIQRGEINPRHEGCYFVLRVIEGKITFEEAVDELVKIPPKRLRELLPINGPKYLTED